MTSEIFTPTIRLPPVNNAPINVTNDIYTNDDQLKVKFRSMNLIKYNPNLFTNRKAGSFLEIIGGYRAELTILLCGALGLYYRINANKLRKLSTREGVWFNTLYFAFGLGLGACYSMAFFWNWQRHANDVCANFLFKRYPNSAKLDRKNIYRLKDRENQDECYRFTSTYANSFHL